MEIIIVNIIDGGVSRKMKIALYQMNIIWENKEANYLRLEEKLKSMSERQIDLFLLPEMSFTGFSMNTDITKENDFRTINQMISYSKLYNMTIGFGWVKDCGEKSENHYSIVSKNGEILSDYVKIHPFSYSGEDKKFQGGKDVVVFRLGNTDFSNFICYDLRFPEIFQIASKKADVILVPANWPKTRNHHWKCLLQARAIENQVYVIAINCVGDIGGIEYSGNSCVINPNGEVLLEFSQQEGILEYELKNNVISIRENFPIKDDRRERLYKDLYDI